MQALRPAERVAGRVAYRVPRHPAPVDLDLRGNEGAIPDTELFKVLSGTEVLRRYPDPRSLQGRLAARFGLAPEQVLVTAGGDDALDRLCRAVLEPGRRLLFPTPGFEMTRRYAGLAGASVVEIPWPGVVFPTEAVLAAMTPGVALVALTSPNNPTGAVVAWPDAERICRAAARIGAVVLLDLAYVEFADADPTRAALQHDNVVVVRTVSKAWGLAGLRVGCALGSPRVLSWMAAAGAPYAVSAPSLALAEAALAAGDAAMESFAAGVREGRQALGAGLEAAGCTVVPSQANFVFARSDRAGWIADGLAGLGIGVRTFPGVAGLSDALRVAVPPTAAGLARLLLGLQVVTAPEVLVVDHPSTGFLGRERLSLPVVRADVSSARALRAVLDPSSASRAWLVTARPEAVRAARAAGVLPLGIARAEDASPDALLAVGAARLLFDASSLTELLP